MSQWNMLPLVNFPKLRVAIPPHNPDIVSLKYVWTDAMKRMDGYLRQTLTKVTYVDYLHRILTTIIYDNYLRQLLTTNPLSVHQRYRCVLPVETLASLAYGGLYLLWQQSSQRHD